MGYDLQVAKTILQSVLVGVGVELIRSIPDPDLWSIVTRRRGEV